MAGRLITGTISRSLSNRLRSLGIRSLLSVSTIVWRNGASCTARPCKIRAIRCWDSAINGSLCSGCRKISKPSGATRVE